MIRNNEESKAIDTIVVAGRLTLKNLPREESVTMKVDHMNDWDHGVHQSILHAVDHDSTKYQIILACFNNQTGTNC